MQGIALWLGLALVHIQYIGEPLKGKERDADGESDLRHRQAGPHPGQIGTQEPGIFEPAQQGQIHCCGQHHGGLGVPPPWGGGQGAHVVYRNGEEHEQQEGGTAVGVEEEAEGQEYPVSPCPCPSGQEIVGRQQQRQKDEEEGHTAEDHGSCPPFLCPS